MLDEQLGATDGGERAGLGLWVLVPGRDPRIPDESHRGRIANAPSMTQFVDTGRATVAPAQTAADRRMSRGRPISDTVPDAARP